MNNKSLYIILVALCCLVGGVNAQTSDKATELLKSKVSLCSKQPMSQPSSVVRRDKDLRVSHDAIAQGGFECRAVVENGDTIPMFFLPTLYVFKPLVFKNKKQEKFYWRTVRDVKRVLPLSYYIKSVIEQTNDTLMTMSTKKERDKYMKAFEKRMYNGNKEEFMSLTLNQGMLLARMVDRTCNATSYDLIKAYMGGFKAGFYQMFAKMFGNDLKQSFGSKEEDAVVERIILMVESGQL